MRDWIYILLKYFFMAMHFAKCLRNTYFDVKFYIEEKVNKGEIAICTFFYYYQQHMAWHGNLQTHSQSSSSDGQTEQGVWDKRKLTWRTELDVLRLYVLSIPFYGSETWAIYVKPEKHLEKILSPLPTMYVRCITCRNKISKTVMLDQANTWSMHVLLCQCRLWWLGHVHRKNDGRIPKDIMNIELTIGHQPVGRHISFNFWRSFARGTWNIQSSHPVSENSHQTMVAAGDMLFKEVQNAGKAGTNCWRWEDKEGRREHSVRP